MSTSTSHVSDKKVIPLGIVLLIIGLILLGTIISVWIIAPSLIPPSMYSIMSELIPETAVTQFRSTTIIVPENVDETTHFVSAETAVRHDPTIGAPVRIIIPKIDLDAPISKIGLDQITENNQTHYQWQVPQKFEAGWHNNSAHLGEAGNTVLNGHHNAYGEVFRDLENLEEGDKIILNDVEQSFEYQVTTKVILPERGQTKSVRISNASWIAATPDERITLITCWPYTENSHRLVIVAKPLNQ